MHLESFSRILISLSVVTLLSGCAAGGLTIPINDPTPSKSAYLGVPQSTQRAINFVDTRSASDKANFSTWLVEMRFVNNGKPLDPFAFVAEHTLKELAARGIPLKRAADGTFFPVDISRINIENYRSSGFSPMVTLTSLVADVGTPQGPKRMVAFVKRAKVPVWGFDELNEPCYDEPMNLITKELAAKINRDVFGLRISDDEVDRLIQKINREMETNPLSYFDVYQLGFGNNPRAIQALVNLAASPKEYIRFSAVSSLGILQASSELPLLIRTYQGIDANLWQDKAIALKAIGDLDTEASRAFLQTEQQRLKQMHDKASNWMLKVVDLYLRVKPTISATPLSLPVQKEPPAAAVTSLPTTQTLTNNTAGSSPKEVKTTPETASTILPQTASSLSSEKKLAGPELKQYFGNLSRVSATLDTGSKIYLDLSQNGEFWIAYTDQAKQYRTFGQYKLREDIDQICLSIKHVEWQTLNDCFSIYYLGKRQFALRSAKNGLAFSYVSSLTPPEPAAPQTTKASQVSPQGNTPQTYATAKPETQLTGPELRQYFGNLSRINATGSGSNYYIELKHNGDLWLTNLRTGGSRTFGKYFIREETNQICFSVKRMDWSNFNDCFTLHYLGKKQFAARSIKGAQSFTFTNSTTPAEPVASATPPLSQTSLPDSVSPSEHQLKGAEITQHFNTLSSVVASLSTGGSKDLQFRRNGDLWMTNLLPYAGNKGFGSYSVREDADQVCFRVKDRRFEDFNHCYRLFSLGGRQFAMRSIDNNFSYTYNK